METVDIYNSTMIYDGHTVWIWCQAALSIMTVIVLYICVCLTWFLWTSMSMHKSTGKGKTQSNESRTGGNAEISARRRRLRMFMRIACLFGAFSALAKFLADQVKFFYAWNARSDNVCEAIYDITDIIMFGFSYAAVYGFLWIKQWLFYCDPVAVKFLYSSRLVIFNRIFIAIILVLSLATAVANWIPGRYKASNSTARISDLEALHNDRSYLGCVAVYDMNDPNDQWPLLTYVTLNTTFQFTLMALFIYPLAWNRLQKWKSARRHKTNCLQRNNRENIHKETPKLPPFLIHIQEEDNTSIETSSYCSNDIKLGRKHTSKKASRRTLSQNALKSIRRTIVGTSVCIVTDTTLVTIFALISKGTPQILIAVATDFDILVNIICIIATYTSWKHILFPVFVRNNVMKRNTASSSQFSSHDFA